MSVQHVFSNQVADGTATSVVRPSDWNSAHNQVMTLVGNTAGQSTISGTNIILQGGNNVTLSANTAAGIATVVISGAETSQFLTTAMQSNAGSNFVAASANFAGTNASGTIASNGVSISVAAPLGAITRNFWMPNPINNNTSFLVPGQNTIYMQHLHPSEPVAISNVEFNCLHSFVSSSNSQYVGMTIKYGLYSHGIGDSTASIVSAATSSMYMQASYNSSTAAGFTCGQGTNSFTITSNNSNLFGTALSGPKFLYLPFTTTLEVNKEYFFAMHFSSTTAFGTGPMRFNMMVQTNINSTVWGELKMSTYAASATNQWKEYDGVQYSTTSSGLPAAVHSTQMQMMASKGRLLMIFENE